jgi:hypothetical protein
MENNAIAMIIKVLRISLFFYWLSKIIKFGANGYNFRAKSLKFGFFSEFRSD